jgi:hypothetical protein
MVATLCTAMKLRGCDSLHCYKTTWLRHSALQRNYVVATLYIAMKLRGCITMHFYETIGGCDTLHCYEKLRGCGTLHCHEYESLKSVTNRTIMKQYMVTTPSIAKKQHCCGARYCYETALLQHLPLQEIAWFCRKTLHCYIRGWMSVTPYTATKLYVWDTFIATPCIAVKLQGCFTLNCCKIAR